MMKKTLLACILTLAGSLFTYAQNGPLLPDWREGYLDIHTIATGRGDACLIIMPDGTTMMIDAGDNGKAKDKQHPDGSMKPGEWQARYMKHFIAGSRGTGLCNGHASSR